MVTIIYIYTKRKYWEIFIIENNELVKLKKGIIKFNYLNYRNNTGTNTLITLEHGK